jgi:TnpA family transposase
MAEYKSAMNCAIKNSITLECRAILNSLFSQSPESQRYRLTLLKKPSQTAMPVKIKNSLADLSLLAELHGYVAPILQQLSLSTEGIRYFSASVIKTKTTHLLRREQADVDLHLIAFIAHQYYRLQDNLVDVFLSAVKGAENNANREHRDWCYDNRKETSSGLVEQIDQLKVGIAGTFEAIRALITDKTLADAKKLERIGCLVSATAASSSTFQKLGKIRDGLTYSSREDSNYYDILEQRSIRLQNRVGGILKVLAFQDEDKEMALMDAIGHFVKKDGAITGVAPLGFLSASESHAVTTGNKFKVSLYKVFLFQHVAGALKSGSLNLLYSHKYRSLDSYLIGKERWQLEKNALLERAGMACFSDPKPLLQELEPKLLAQFTATNRNIHSGSNPYIKLRKNGDFCVNTPKQEEHLTEPLAPFLPVRHFVPLTEILATVNWQTKFSDELQHWQQQYNRDKPIRTLFAGLIGLGCAIGIRKMARISNQIGEEELENTVNWHFSLDNMQAANDCVLGYMDNMELPNIYRRSPDSLHTASDGQKFEVSVDSLNANYSFKYFGKGQGVSAYTFIDERNLLWHSLVFSAAERESAYVIDGLMRNDVVKSDIHSTDTHGYSEVIFAVTHLLGFSFAPRIKNLKKQSLYMFKAANDKEHKDWAIKPAKAIDVALIEEHWDDILRLITTVKLKENTASEIFRRLNSYSKQHRLYAALKAFGRIIKSLFIMRYIDDVELRQAIEKQLNKVELANRFTRAIAVGNPREFVAGEKEEQEIAEACNRLIKNTIICWNYMYLEKELKQSDPEKKATLLGAIKTHSPMSWAHINLLGEYDFSDTKMQDSCGILLSRAIHS